MKYLRPGNTGAGFHFWRLVNQLFFDDEREQAILGGITIMHSSIPRNKLVAETLQK